MPVVIKRHFLREKEIKRVLQELSHNLYVKAEQLLGPKPRIQIAEIQSTQIFIVNGKPILARLEGKLFPTMIFDKIFPFLPKITVDMGAVPHLCNGADVMAPGIVCINGCFNKDDILLVVDERHGKPLAIGVALFDSQHMRELKHGRVVKNLHYVGDRLWNILKKMQQSL